MKSNIKIKRIGNLEFNRSSYLGSPPIHPSWEIRFYYPNSYYGRKSEYKYIGDGMYQNPNYDFCRIHESCFKSAECCYTLGSFEWDDHEAFYEFHFCGNRPMDLKEENWGPFRELLIYGDEMLNSRDEEED